MKQSTTLRAVTLSVALAVLSLSILASPAAAGARSAAAEVPISDVMAEVSRALNNYRYDDIFDWIQASVDGRTVILSGAVYMPWKRDSLQKRIASIPGVAQVDNRIEVLPVSGFDDRIRYQVARSIYGSHSFFDRARWTSPPIHIVVAKGRITLEGVVRNEAERMLARSLASRSPLSIGKIENNLLLESEIAR